MSEELPPLGVTVLTAWPAGIFERAGLPADDAAVAAEVLIAADLRGIESHGVLHLPRKVQRILSGRINPAPRLRVDPGGPAALRLDGDNGLGMVVGVRAMQLAIERAGEFGTALVCVRRSNHFGIAGYYAQLAAAAGQVGLCCTNASKGLAPWGSLTPYLSTNPLAFAVPGGIPGGLVLDMATSQVAWGKVEVAAQAGRKIPLTWATDRSGRPTDDPRIGMQGLMQPLGGYKGSGLAMMVDILCGVLSGAAFGSHIGDFYAEPDRHEGVGHFFMALDIRRILPLEQFLARMAQLVDEVHACQPLPGIDRIYVPGEIEMETARRQAQDGIPLPGILRAQRRQLGEQLREPFVA